MKLVKFHLNGEAQEILAPPDEPLIDVLRETFKLKSVKAGCGPQRECGCCLALIDGQPKVTCSVKVAQVHGRTILTLEGVSDNERQLYADAFQAAGGLQCGFCTPGLVMAAVQLLKDNPKASEAEIRAGLDGNLCRCTGYQNIVAAVKEAAARM
jgi:xanthine dehydrogenase molybdenum-binding subunit